MIVILIVLNYEAKESILIEFGIICQISVINESYIEIYIKRNIKCMLLHVINPRKVILLLCQSRTSHMTVHQTPDQDDRDL